MSPLKIKPGKKPARLKPANAYPARDPRLEDTTTHPYPISSALPPSVDDDGGSFPMLAQSTEPPEFMGETFTPLQLQTFPAALDAPDEPVSEAVRVISPAMSGGSMHNPAMNGDVAPAPLPRSWNAMAGLRC